MTPAVVVGLCAHGLGIVRDLARAGIPVIALEQDRGLPGIHTRCAEVRLVPDINGPGLLDALDEVASGLPEADRPVLFLTSDRIVSVVARQVERVAARYRLSWSDAAGQIQQLLDKQAIEGRCRAVGLHYPRSALVTRRDDLDGAVQGLRAPLIAKPTRPLSAFKTLVWETADAASADALASSLPVLVQEFIPGGDAAIRFASLHLHQGEVMARFEGRKLFSRPMGHTTIAISEPDDEIHQFAVRFFAGLRLSGPVSLEVKQAPDGSWWVIEPTVGRTDFWAGLCSANGVNLPLVHYCCETGQTLPPCVQGDICLWINGERQPEARLWLVRHFPSYSLRHSRGVFLAWDDPLPFLTAGLRWARALPGRILRKGIAAFGAP